MAAKITTEITESNFEKVRDQVGIILAEELAYQAANFDSSVGITVWKERFAPIGKEEIPCAEISLESGDWEWQTIGDANGAIMYNIDLYSRGSSSGSAGSIENGGTPSKELLHKLIRQVFKIFSHAAYLRLNFASENNPIGSVEVKGFRIATKNELPNLDSENISMARVQLEVQMNEFAGESEAIVLTGADTDVTLNESDLGYSYEVNN